MIQPSREPSLEFDGYADAIADAAVVLRDNAARAGMESEVPTCPGWTVRRLVAHQGMVHRWAAAALSGDRVDTAAIEREALGLRDPLDWFADGVEVLLRSLDRTPDDAEAWFFLPAPSAKLGWARRQCHETTMHAVDAMSATLGVPPAAGQVWFGARLAVDGVDELLTGFVPRPRTPLRSESPRRVHVGADDVDARWTLDVGPDGVRTTREARDGATTTVEGTAVDLYLGLWNRGDRITERGQPFLDTWHAEMVVGW